MSSTTLEGYSQKSCLFLFLEDVVHMAQYSKAHAWIPAYRAGR